MKKTGEQQPLPSLFVKGQPLGGMENIAKMVESVDFQKMLDSEGIEHNLAQIQSKDYLKRLVPLYDSCESIERILYLNGVDFTTVEHEANLAASRLAEFLSFPEEVKNVVFSKTRLLTNNQGKYWLACLPWNKEIDLAALQQYLKEKAPSFSYADEGTLQRKTGCSQGNANFFSLLNVNRTCDVTVLFDKELYHADWISAHPMDTSASTVVNKEGVSTILELAGRSDDGFQILNFDDLSSPKL